MNHMIMRSTTYIYFLCRWQLLLISLLFLSSVKVCAQLSTSQLFSDNMILQRAKPLKLWGWSDPGDRISVRFENQVKQTIADASGSWHVYLDPLRDNNKPQELKIIGKKDTLIIRNVLIGDVWLLGGQSNMEMDLDRIYNGDLEVASANFNAIRLMTIPRQTGVRPTKNFKPINEYDDWLGRYDQKGEWFMCNSQTVKTFSGIGYIFGRRLHMASQVPIGLIDASLGGTTLEAWLPPSTWTASEENKQILVEWDRKAAAFDPITNLAKKVEQWEIRTKERKAQGLEPLPKPLKPDESPHANRNFPAASFNGMIYPVVGLSLKGIIFHQGYNNALSNDARPVLYAKNMCLLITSWRQIFSDNTLPFGIIELSAGGTPQTTDNLEIQMTDAAPFIREAQFVAYQQLKHVGIAGAYDQQENWFHPRKKIEPAERMARWALDQYYNIPLGWMPASLVRMEVRSDSVLLYFDREIKTHDDRDFEGFTISGADRHFFPAVADYFKHKRGTAAQDSLDKKTLVLRSALVSQPQHARYAWARNPLGNAVSASIRERVIPVPSFRTDPWNYPEAPVMETEFAAYRKIFAAYKQAAADQVMTRKKLEQSRSAANVTPNTSN